MRSFEMAIVTMQVIIALSKPIRTSVLGDQAFGYTVNFKPDGKHVRFHFEDDSEQS